MTVVLACDLGGTSFRAALVEADGAMLAEARILGPTLIDRLGWSEVDAADWWRLFRDSAARLADEAPDAFGRVAAIAICGVTRTQVFLGRDGRQLRNAMTWKDIRAEALLGRLKDVLPASHPETERVNAFHPVARLAWLKQEEEATFRSLACLLEPKDYLNFRLTGIRAADPVSIARLIASAEPGPSGEPDLLTALGLSPALIPPRVEPWQPVGPVMPGLPAPFDRLAGVPVICSSSDTWIGVVGLGAMRPGFGYNISGTTEVLGVVGEGPSTADGLLTVDWRGLYQLGGPSQNGADTIAWLAGLVGGTGAEQAGIGAWVEDILARPRHPQPALFLPYLQGERVPYWDPSLRGAFIGLNRQHGVQDLLWAMMEGVAFLNRIVLERAEAATAEPVAEIRFGGGAAANPVWRQIKADICGRPIVVGASPEPGILGAAIVALTALGRFASLAAAQEALGRVAARHAPHPERRRAYDRLFALFREAETALAPISAGLVGLSRQMGAAGVRAPALSKETPR